MKKIALGLYVMLATIVAIATRSLKPTLTNAESLNISKLTLTSMCSPQPDVYRVWRVRNPNPSAIAVQWDLHGINITGTLTAIASGDSFFQTPTQNGANTTKIWAAGKVQDTKASNPAACAPILNDLILSAVSNKTGAIPGDLITHTLSYINSGNTTLTGVIINITLNTQHTLFSSSLSGYTVSGTTYSRTLGTLTGNQTGTLILYTYGDQWTLTGNHSLQGSIKTSSPESTLTNNTITRTFPIIQGNQCISQGINSNLIINTNYLSPVKDIFIQSISFNGNIFPGLILADAFVQRSPLPNQQEISTDRGDQATSLYTPEENPSYSGLLDYLGNNNLNNIIDIEGSKTSILDLRFSQTLVDNNTGNDGLAELVIFERGMNSDLTIQAIDALEGTGIGTSLTLRRNQQTELSGIMLDTLEIGAPQKLGYRKIDLNQLGVPSLKYLRIIATTGSNGPDIKILGINTLPCSTQTSNLEIKGLTNIISTLPGDTFTYTLTIKNLGTDKNYDIITTTTLSSGIMITTGSIPFVMSGNSFQLSVPTLAVGSSVVYTFTGTLSPSLKIGDAVTLKSTLSGLIEDQETINNTDTSSINITSPSKLKLAAVCSTDPVNHRTRRITNTNPMSVSYQWTQGSNSGTGSAEPGDSFVSTPGSTENVSIQLFAFDNQLQSTRSSNPISCPLPVADLDISLSTPLTGLQAGEIFTGVIHRSQKGPNNAPQSTIKLQTSSMLQAVGLNTPFTASGNILTIELGELGISSGSIIITGTIASGWKAGSMLTLSGTIQGNVVDPTSTNNQSILTLLQPEILNTTGQQNLINQLLDTNQLEQVDENQQAQVHNAAEVEIELDNPKSLVASKNQNLIGGGCRYDDEDYLSISFKDITRISAKNAIEFLRLNCIVKGRTLNQFKPGAFITRAEATKIFVKLRGIKHQLKVQGEQFIYLGDTPFHDVTNIHRSAQYMDIAHQLGIIKHMTQTTDDGLIITPDQELTKQEAIELMVKTKLLMDDQLMIEENSLSNKNIYITYALSQGWIRSEKESVLSQLDKPITREQLSTLIAQPFQNLLKVYTLARN